MSALNCSIREYVRFYLDNLIDAQIKEIVI